MRRRWPSHCLQRSDMKHFYSMQPWQQVSEESVKVGFRKVLKRSYRLPNDEISEYTIFDEGQTACILALTPENEVILVKQFRPGPAKMLFELPGGGIEKNEEALAAAQRELLEETGYSGEMRFVTTAFHSAYSTMIRHCFVATNCKKIAEPTPDEHEFLETVLMSLPDFREHLRSGNLTDTTTGYLGLDALKLL